MLIDSTKIFNSASQFANNAVNSVDSARDSVLNYLNTNLPVSLTSKFSLVAKTINDSGFAKFLEEHGTTPALTSALFLGAIGGSLLLNRPVIALVSLSAAGLLTSNKTHLTMAAGSTLFGTAISGSISLARRASII